MKSVLKLMRSDIAALAGYRSARSELSQTQEGLTWLDANENPWPPYPGLPETRGYNRYPDPQPAALMRTLAELYHVPQNHLLVTRGSDEGIDVLLRMFCRAEKDAILICPPTYGYYQVAAAIQGARVVEVPLDGKFQLRETAILRAWKPNIKLLLLCSPNNPTGNLLNQKTILRLCKKLDGKAVVVVDEAYLEFSSAASLAEKIAAAPNLVVLRTFSKAHGMAGIRCGATIAAPEIMDVARRVLAPYPIPVTTTQVVLNTLTPEGLEAMRQHVQTLIQERARMRSALAKHPSVLKIFPSDANFLLLQTKNAKAFLQVCRSHHIVLRDRSSDLPNSARLTIGAPEENDRVLRALGLGRFATATADRSVCLTRKTAETKITARLSLESAENIEIQTGVAFFDHMLAQLAKHAGFSLSLQCKGDLAVDAHHTVEDCGIVVGQALKQALGDKRGIGRYGFLLPMDESLAQVAMDLSGRGVCKFEGNFPDAMAGQFPTEMTSHFFRTLAESLGAAIHIKVEGENTHHMVEACFKGVGRALRMAIRRDGIELPSTKGVL